MADCRINAQNDIIESIILALKTCSHGEGMAIKYDIERIGDDYSSTLVFTLKPEYELNPADFYWLGHHVGEEYLEND